MNHYIPKVLDGLLSGRPDESNAFLVRINVYTASNARILFVHKYLQLSITMSACIRLSHQRQTRLTEIVQCSSLEQKCGIAQPKIEGPMP